MTNKGHDASWPYGEKLIFENRYNWVQLAPFINDQG
jgi:hypothetical protein